MIVEGALRSKASGVVLVDASRVPGEGEEEGLLMRRGSRSDSGRGVGASNTIDWCGIETKRPCQ